MYKSDLTWKNSIYYKFILCLNDYAVHVSMLCVDSVCLIIGYWYKGFIQMMNNRVVRIVGVTKRYEIHSDQQPVIETVDCGPNIPHQWSPGPLNWAEQCQNYPHLLDCWTMYCSHHATCWGNVKEHICWDDAFIYFLDCET